MGIILDVVVQTMKFIPILVNQIMVIHTGHAVRKADQTGTDQSVIRKSDKDKQNRPFTGGFNIEYILSFILKWYQNKLVIYV